MKRMLLTAAVLALGATMSLAQAAGDPAAGKAKAARCAGCHGANGEGKGANPALAGKSADELSTALKDFKAGKGKNAAMKGIAKGLSDADIDNYAAYYSGLKGK